jgi:hypothetical protein
VVEISNREQLAMKEGSLMEINGKLFALANPNGRLVQIDESVVEMLDGQVARERSLFVAGWTP